MFPPIPSVCMATDVYHRRNCAYRGWRSSDKLLVADWKRTLARNTKHLAVPPSASSLTTASLLVFMTMLMNRERERKGGGIRREKPILWCTGWKLRRDGISCDGMRSGCCNHHLSSLSVYFRIFCLHSRIFRRKTRAIFTFPPSS